MSNETLRRDLRRRIQERFNQWIRDVADLYDTMDLERGEMEEDTLKILSSTMVWALIRLGLTPRDIGQFFHDMAKEEERKQKQEQANE